MSKSAKTDTTDDRSECPTCGDLFDTRRGMKVHHSIVHDERITVSLECKWCEEVFKVPESHENRRTFCSTECKAQYRSNSGEWSGENHPGYKRVSKECEKCSSTFSVKQFKAERRRFCSQSCFQNWVDDSRSGENHPEWVKRVKVECETCGENIEVIKSQAEDTRFCSQDCLAEWRSTQTGPDAPYWQGGGTASIYRAVRTGLNYESWSSIRSEQIGEKCEICGNKEELHLHHIIPVLCGGTNESWNLMTLCRSCHTECESYTDDFTQSIIPDSVKASAKEKIHYYIGAN